MKGSKALFVTLAMLIGAIRISSMELPVPMETGYPRNLASLQGLPSDLKLYLLPYIAKGNLECGIVKFASISKAYHNVINQPTTIIALLNAMPYTDPAIRLAERLQTRVVALPVMRTVEVKNWLDVAKKRLRNGQKLVSAALLGNVNEVKTLLQNPNIHLNYFDTTGISPLIQDVAISLDFDAAERQARLTILELLLNAGADPNVQVDSRQAPHIHPRFQKMTPLLWAARLGHVDFVSKLLAAGANPDLKNTNGKTAHTIESEPDVSEESRAEINRLLDLASAKRKKAAASNPDQADFCIVQ